MGKRDVEVEHSVLFRVAARQTNKAAPCLCRTKNRVAARNKDVVVGAQT